MRFTFLGCLLLAALLLTVMGCGGSSSDWWEWPPAPGVYTNNLTYIEDEFTTFSVFVGEDRVVRGLAIFFGEDETCFLDLYSLEPDGLATIENWEFFIPISTQDVQGTVHGFFTTPFIVDATFQLQSTSAANECEGFFSGETRGFRTYPPDPRSFFPDQAPFRGISRANPDCRCLAWGDFDGDGDEDLFSGIHTEEYTSTPDLLGPRFYLNIGGIRNDAFVEDGGALGLLDPDGQVSGCAWGDFNGDGLPDLFMGRDPSASILYRQTSIGTFEETTFGRGIGEARGKALWVDFDGDGDLDLSTSAGLFANNYPGDFEKLEPGPELNGPYFEWTDFDLDGDPDLYVLLEEPDGSRYDHLYRNDGGLFTEMGMDAGLSLSFRGDQACWGDFNRDALPDLAVIAADQDALLLFENQGDGTFADTTQAAALPQWEWGSYLSALDYNGDGELDLVGTTSNRERPIVFLGGLGTGRFNPGSFLIYYPVQFPGQTGMAWADYDRDGDLDMAFPTQRSLSLHTNNFGGNYLKVNAITDRNGNAQEEDDEGDRLANGARIEVDLTGDATFLPENTRIRWVGLRMQDSLTVHFGIGGYSPVSLRVTFPDGSQVTEPQVQRNRTVTVYDPQ